MPLHEQLAGAAALAVLALSLAGWLQALVRWRAGQPLAPLSPREPVPWTFADLLVVIVAYIATLVQSFRWFLGDEPFSPETATAEDLWAFFVAQGLANVTSIPIAIVITRFRIGARLWAALRRIWHVLVSAEQDESAELLRHAPSPAMPRDWGLTLRHLASDVTLGCVAFCMLAPPVLALQAILTRWFPYEHLLIVALREHMTTSLFVVGLIVAVIIAPLFEEFFFRVLLQGWMERFGSGGTPRPDVPVALKPTQATPSSAVVTAEAIAAPNPYAPPEPRPTTDDKAVDQGVEKLAEPPPRWPIFVSAVIFALLHAGNGPDPIPLFFLAIGLGYLYRQTHRIVPSMTVHFLLNGASMTLLWMELTYGAK